MAYATQIDLQRRIGDDRLIQWADDRRTGSPDAAIITAALAWADAQIHAALAARFAAYLPFTTPPELVFQIAVTFGVWYLASRMQDTGELWKFIYEEARALLAQLAEGRMDLITTTGVNLTQSGAHAPRITDDTDMLFPTSLALWRNRHVISP